VLAPLTAAEREQLARLVTKLAAGHGLDAELHRETRAGSRRDASR
jgi:hypothetical protein